MVKQKKIKYMKRKETDDGAKLILKHLLSPQKLVLVDVGTGGGKTFMSIRAIGVYDKNAHILVLTTKAQVQSNDWQASIDSYNQENNTNLTYTIETYSATQGSKKKQKLKQELKEHQHQSLYIVADEAHKIRNPKNKNFKAVKQLINLKQSKGLIMLTADPISESPFDPCGYLILAGYYKNISDFNKQHVVEFDKYWNPVIKNPYTGKFDLNKVRNLPQLIERYKSIRIHIDTSKSKPPLITKDLTFKYDKKTQREYNQIGRNWRDGVYESISEAIAEQRKFLSTHCTKRLHAMSKILKNTSRPDDPILIFYKYNNQLLVLKDYLTQNHPDFDVFEINGSNKVDTNQHFKEKTVILCQYTAAGEALNASFSHCTIFFEATYSWKEYHQAKGRNNRAFQKGTTYQFRFIVDKTISEHYWHDLIDQKKSLTTTLQKDYLNHEEV